MFSREKISLRFLTLEIFIDISSNKQLLREKFINYNINSIII